MPWKERFVTELQGRGLTASESDMPDEPSTVRSELTQVSDWWGRLDTHTKTVIKWSGADVANAMYYAGFGSSWPGLINLLGQNVAGQVVPSTYNEIGRAWNALGNSGDVDNESLHDQVVQELDDV